MLNFKINYNEPLLKQIKDCHKYLERLKSIKINEEQKCTIENIQKVIDVFFKIMKERQVITLEDYKCFENEIRIINLSWGRLLPSNIPEETQSCNMTNDTLFIDETKDISVVNYNDLHNYNFKTDEKFDSSKFNDDIIFKNETI